MTSLAKLKKQLLADKEVKNDYERMKPILEFLATLTRARVAAGLSQAQLAARLQASEFDIERLENARAMPPFETLTRYAAAIGFRLDLHLVPLSRK